MSSTATEFASTLEEQYFSAVKQAQDLALDAVRSVAGLVTPLVADLPSLPFADQLPKPEETVEAGFAFVEKVIANQHDFVKQLVDAVTVKPASSN